MSLVLNTNIASLNAQQALNNSQTSLNTSLQRLSSGLRINSAKDDAAGLQISQRMTAQVNGDAQATSNANDAISMSQTGEGALGQMGNLLQRIRQLSVQAANGTNSASDRQAINAEVTQLTGELDRFAQTTQFNGINLFDGSSSSSKFQVGANANQTITTTTANFRTASYGAQQIGVTTPTSTAVTGTSTTAAITGAAVSASGTLNIKGGVASGSITLSTSDSAFSIANKINAQTQTGVTASAQTVTTVTFSASGSYTLNVLGSNTTAQQVTFNLTASNTAAGLADAVTEFNNQTGVTGVTAALNQTGTGVVLTSSEGDNISLTASTATSEAGAITAGGHTLASGAAGTITVAGNVVIDASQSYTVSSASTAATTASTFGTVVAAGGQLSSTLKSVSTLNVTSVDNATQAIRIVDAALNAVNGQRAQYGALQNRFSATVSNLQTTSQNLQSARSQIQDADFASETANLTKSQILQQAGTAMLAQANTLPQNILTLLSHL
ncbi:MAG: flagellin [Burkholderiales bacterium]|nr:flagellin [Burkholderiales bacterium]